LLPRAIVSDTRKGYGEYAKSALRASISDRSQSHWFVHPSAAACPAGRSRAIAPLL
jgi:hypothetical protein